MLAAAADAGIGKDEQALAAPRGMRDLVEAFFDGAEAAAARTLAKHDMSALRVPDKVALGVRTWLDALEPNRDAVQRAATRGLLPWTALGGAADATRRTWSVADMVWTAAGDTSEDYNRYSKRGLLAAVIPAITLYWLSEPESDKLDAFINTRLRRVSKLGQFRAKLVKPVLNRFAGAKPAPTDG